MTDFKKLDREQMLELWRLRRHLEPLGVPGSVERDDAVDSLRLLETEMAEWYEGLLLSLPAEQLPTVDLAGDSTVYVQADGSWRVTLPERAVRVADVEVEGWKAAAVIADDSDIAVVRAQQNPFSRGNEWHPVVIAARGKVWVYTPPAGATRLKKLECVMRPPEGEYWLTPAMMPPMFDDYEYN